MSREIKFRYIVKHIESGNIETKVYSLTQIEQRPLKELSPVFLADYELLGKSQFTGLNDSNGDEIYEDDLVNNVGWSDFQDEDVYVVGFLEGEYRLEAPPLKDYQFYNGDSPHGDRAEGTWEECSIIGNIYQNPELLEESE